jgi:hypothetical protein
MRKNQELTFGKTPARRPRSNGHTVKELLIFKPEDLKYAILIYRRPGRSYHVFPGLAVSQCGIHPCRSQKPVRPCGRARDTSCSGTQDGGQQGKSGRFVRQQRRPFLRQQRRPSFGNLCGL